MLGLQTGDIVLDIDCGLRGPARLAAANYGCEVTGVDLTEENVATGRTLNAWLGLETKVDPHTGDATALPFPDASFDKANILLVGMNIASKTALAAEIARVLKLGGRAAVYDVMRTGPGDLSFPVPWAETAAGNAAAPADDYRTALTAAGLNLEHHEDRGAIALVFFAKMRAAAAKAEGPPSLGLHILMGATAPAKVANMVSNISEARISPMLMVCAKP